MNNFDASRLYFGGVHGGVRTSTANIYNGDGVKLAESTTGGTNHWIIGMEECEERIFRLMQDCKTKAKVPIKQPLDALCLSLSGCEQSATNTKLRDSLRRAYPYLSKSFYVCSDTVAPIAAVTEEGGVVIIAGCGSNALLLENDGSLEKAGGWGHLLGDEGSGYWIASEAIRVIYNYEDGIASIPNNYNPTPLWDTIRTYFSIHKGTDILPFFYSRFDKSRIAGLCKEIAKVADLNDPLSQWIFAEAGKHLARLVIAVASKCKQELLNVEGGIPVVCVGSVWKSWNHIEPGFRSEIRENTSRVTINELSLLKLNVKPTVGAVYLAAKSVGFDIPRTYRENYSVFYHFQRNNS